MLERAISAFGLRDKVVIELVTNMKTSESPFTAGHDFIHIILDVSIPKFSSLKLSPASPAATSRESTQNNFKI